jgi:periplasmic protein TonB
MKPFLLAAILVNSFLFSAAQNGIPPAPPLKNNVSRDAVGAFDKVEVEAAFAGGDTAWRSFLIRNLNVDDITDRIKFPKSRKVFQQTAIVRFIVCTNGSLCNIETENKVNPLIKAEVERVMKLSPNWMPAIVEGKPVKAYRRQPITILIERE